MPKKAAEQTPYSLTGDAMTLKLSPLVQELLDEYREHIRRNEMEELSRPAAVSRLLGIALGQLRDQWEGKAAKPTRRKR